MRKFLFIGLLVYVVTGVMDLIYEAFAWRRTLKWVDEVTAHVPVMEYVEEDCDEEEAQD